MLLRDVNGMPGQVTGVLLRRVPTAISDPLARVSSRLTVGDLSEYGIGRALLAGGERIRPDAVIACAGYRRGLEPLVGHLGLIRPNGRPVVHGPDMHPDAPDLHFIGYTNPISGMFREFGIDARKIARVQARRRRPVAAGSSTPGGELSASAPGVRA